MSHTYFRQWDLFCEQTAKESLVSLVLAGLFMEEFTLTAQMTAERQPPLRYARTYDSFIICPCGEELSWMLSGAPEWVYVRFQIRFTVETEEKVSCLS